VEEFIPIVLIVIGWYPEHPGKIEVVERHVVPTFEQCNITGAAAVEQGNMKKLKLGGAEFAYLCIASPNVQETEAAFDQLVQKSKADAENRKELEK
jgi:hypothetical protein